MDAEYGKEYPTIYIDDILYCYFKLTQKSYISVNLFKAIQLYIEEYIEKNKEPFEFEALIGMNSIENMMASYHGSLEFDTNGDIIYYDNRFKDNELKCPNEKIVTYVTDLIKTYIIKNKR